jgi:hypothetical protein
MDITTRLYSGRTIEPIESLMALRNDEMYPLPGHAIEFKFGPRCLCHNWMLHGRYVDRELKSNVNHRDLLSVKKECRRVVLEWMRG